MSESDGDFGIFWNRQSKWTDRASRVPVWVAVIVPVDVKSRSEF